MRRSLNRKLLVSVFNPQEAREAVLGGGRIIDSEDPKTALGNISPLRIMQISDAVLDYQRDLDVQLSTNIGEDQLIFRRSSTGRAIEKSPQEMAGKAAQAALGVALSMGTKVHPCGIVKVGLDGMSSAKLHEVLKEVVDTLRRVTETKHTPVMSVLFAQDLDAWDIRKKSDAVRGELVALREFSPAQPGAENSFGLLDHWDRLLTVAGEKLPERADRSDQDLLKVLKDEDILPPEATDDTVVLNELFPHDFEEAATPTAAGERRTTRDVIKAMVDLTASAGADAMMLDTSILSKASNICLVDTTKDGMADFNSLLIKNGLPLQGILSLSDIQFFVDYCHFKGIIPNIAGSVSSLQAQQLWARVPQLDQISTRSAASATLADPSREGESVAHKDTRAQRTIVRQLVAGLAPPEDGGQLNVPIELNVAQAQAKLQDLLVALRQYREAEGLPPLRAAFFSKEGVLTPIADPDPPSFRPTPPPAPPPIN